MSEPSFGLTDAQRQAVHHDTGPMMVFAGPGSGKTLVVTFRLTRLIERGVDPSKVLCVTFTKNAAREMRERVETLLGDTTEDGPKLVYGTDNICTFHSYCCRWIRGLPREFLLGRTSRFIIADQADQKKLLRQCRDSLSDEDRKSIEGEKLVSWIGRLKSRGVRPENYKPEAQETLYYDVWSKYEKVLLDCNAFDFDDLLIVAADALDKDESLRQQFDYLMVDEFQDTNAVQYRICKALGHHQNVFVVGDVHQSIYAFRGAQPANVELFRSSFPNCKTVMLDRCYRSTPEIIGLCDKLIAHNPSVEGRTAMTPVRDHGPLPRLWSVQTSDNEARRVAQDIVRLHKNGTDYGDMAVIYRNHNIGRKLEEQLVARQVPYWMSYTPFYSRQHVRDILAYMRLVCFNDSNLDCRRVINVPPRKIGYNCVDRLRAVAEENDVSFFDAIPLGLEDKRFTKVQAAGLEAFREIVQIASRMKEHEKPRVIVKWLLQKTGLADAARQKLQEAVEKAEDQRSVEKAERRYEDLRTFVEAVQTYEVRCLRRGVEATMEDFLEEAALTAGEKGPRKGAVGLMTAHASKGREFSAVWVIGVEDKVWPHWYAVRDGDITEERRLLYVAMSRAMDRLRLCFPEVRTEGGYLGTNRGPSSLLYDIEGCVAVEGPYPGYELP